MKNVLLPIMVLFTSLLAAQNKPYPQGINHPGCLKPNNITQTVMDNQVYSYYTYWKGKYLKNDLNSLPGGYYVMGEITGGADGYTPLGSSEGQGYGMIIAALFAGKDPDAQIIFDGLYKTARAYKSSINANLMGWVVADDINAQGSFSSATDGDLDIAYALLLAHYQWGSTGTINYLQAAKDMITLGIKAAYVTNSYRTNLGDWDSKSSLNSRPSDWFLDHFRAFKDATNDVVWDNVISATYSMISSIQTNYSSTTGLLPDFCTGNPVSPAAPNFLESANDGDYYYNACRTPLRIAMDYGHYGEIKAKDAVNKIITWAKTKTGNDASKFKAGYTLAGANVSGNNYYDAVFVAPIVAGSIVDPNNQAFLNAGWSSIIANKNVYFSDSYNLLCQLFITGNWWIPKATVITEVDNNEFINTGITLTPNPTNNYLTITNTGSSLDIVILNSLGEEVLTKNNIESEHILNVASLSSGVYILKSTNGKTSFVNKFIKE
jgi:endoglucanase